MKSAAKNHPTGLSLLFVTLVVAIGNRAGLDISEDTAYQLLLGVGVVVSFLSPRFKKRWSDALDGDSPAGECINQSLSDERPVSTR